MTLTFDQLDALIDQRRVTLDYTRGAVSGITVDYGNRTHITEVPSAWTERLRTGQVAKAGRATRWRP